MRRAAVIEGGVVTNVIVIADGAEGDQTIADIGCVEITDLDPRPAIGWSWSKSKGFTKVVTAEEQARIAEVDSLKAARQSASEKLAALGLSETEIKALLG